MKYALVQILIYFSFHAGASHIAAGEMYYDYLGNNDYEVHILLYRDCSGSGWDHPLTFTVFDQGNNVLQQEQIFLDTSNVELVDYTTIVAPSCLSQFTGACLEYYTYSKVINLPPIVGGYVLSYQRCCLTGQIVNIDSPDLYGYTFSCKIPGLETGHYENSSPRFQGHSLFLSCINSLISFDHTATDPDGDSLVYSLLTPKAYELGVGGTVAEPNPELPPPYIPLPYASGFGSQVPLGLGGTLTINSLTGLMMIEPVMVGQFAIGVKVDEYKSDTLISTTYRNLNMQVTLGDTAEINESSLFDQFSISPNPIINKVQIRSERVHDLTVFSAAGKVIYRRSAINEEVYVIQMDQFESGIYYFQFESNTGKIIKKVIN